MAPATDKFRSSHLQATSDQSSPLAFDAPAAPIASIQSDILKPARAFTRKRELAGTVRPADRVWKSTGSTPLDDSDAEDYPRLALSSTQHQDTDSMTKKNNEAQANLHSLRREVNERLPADQHASLTLARPGHMRRELASLSEKIQDKDEHIECLNVILKDLQKDLVNVKALKLHDENENDVLKERLKLVESEKTNLKTAMNSLTSTTRTLRNTHDTEMHQAAEAHRSEINALKGQLLSKKGGIRLLREQSRVDTEAFNERTDHLKAQLAMKDNDLSSLQSQVEAAAETHRREIERREEQLRKHKNNCTTLQHQIDAVTETSKEELERLRTELGSQNKDLLALRAQKEKALDASLEESRIQLKMAKMAEAAKSNHTLEVESRKKRSSQTTEDLRIATAKADNLSNALRQQEGLTAQAKATVARLKPFETRAHDLKLELERKEEFLEDLERRVSLQRRESTTEVFKLQTEVQRLKEEVHAAKNASDKHQQEALQIKQLELSNDSLTRQLSEAQSAQEQLSTLTAKYDGLKRGHALSKTEYSEALNKLRQETETEKSFLTKEIVGLEAKLGGDQAASEKAKQQYEGQISNLSKELAEVRKNEANMSSLQQEIERLETTIVQERATSEKTRQEQHQQISDLSMELAESRKRENENHTLEEEIVRLKARIAQDQATSKKTRLEHDQQIRELSQELAERREKETENGSLRKEIERLKAKSDQDSATSEITRSKQEQQIHNFLQELAESRDMIRDAKKQEQLATSEVKKQGLKLREMEDAATNAVSMISDLRGRLDRMTSSLRETIQELENALNVVKLNAKTFKELAGEAAVTR